LLHPGGGDVVIGNICPRLTPLHTLMQPPPSAEEKPQRLVWLQHLLEMELRLNQSEQMRLDIGLSNFGLDAQGDLFYLDDDFYSSDGFVSLAQMLGVYLRAFDWINEVFVDALGDSLNILLAQHFVDPHCHTVLAEQLRGLFMPNPAKRAILSSLAQRLRARPMGMRGAHAPLSSLATAQEPAGEAPLSPAASIQPALNASGAASLPEAAAAKPSPLLSAAFASASQASGAASAAPARRIALLADIHANLPALDAVLDYLAREGIAEALVLGDIVGYGPHPAECVERLRESGLRLSILRGNHDHAAATGLCEHGFSNSARWCIEWSLPRLNEAQKAWLLDLPVFLQEGDWLAVHGAPLDPSFFNAYVYAMTCSQNLDVLEERGLAICFHGHTHIAGVYGRAAERTDARLTGPDIALREFAHALVCPGSVGQPRNREVGAQLAVLDWEERHLHLATLPYNLERTLADMEAAGFPASLTKRLVTGQ
jgi:predicted phosphodiesterase